MKNMKNEEINFTEQDVVKRTCCSCVKMVSGCKIYNSTRMECSAYEPCKEAVDFIIKFFYDYVVENGRVKC